MYSELESASYTHSLRQNQYVNLFFARNCPVSTTAHNTMVKTLKEMGIKVGEGLAKEKCLEDMKKYEIEIEKLKNDVQNLKDLKSDVKEIKSDVKKLKDLESDLKILQVFTYKHKHR